MRSPVCDFGDFCRAEAQVLIENGSAVIPWREKRVMAAMAIFALIAFLLVAAFHIPTAFMIIGGAIVGAFCFRPPKRAESA